MKIDGKAIADEILTKLTTEVKSLKSKEITPTLAVVLIGNNKASLSYVKQKQLVAEGIGAKVKLFKFESITEDKLLELIRKLNKDSSIHGIIVQRPLPSEIDKNKVPNAVDLKKDVDGFNTNSNFDVPVALAVIEILKKAETTNLSDKKIVVLGKGETVGGPIAELLIKLGTNPDIIDSKTKNKDEIIKSADIIISAVGRENIIKPELLSSNQILVGVGLFSKNGKLAGDYNISEIEGKVKYYTPTIGGVGPVNVAMLMDNLVYSTVQKY